MNIVDTYKVRVEEAPTLDVVGTVVAVGTGTNTAFGELAVAENTPVAGLGPLHTMSMRTWWWLRPRAAGLSRLWRGRRC